MIWLSLKRIVIASFSILALFLVTGTTYQYVSTKVDEMSYPPMGQMVDVGGYRMHINCIGEGGPTVVLDAGLGCNSLDWTLVQPEIAKFARVCSYDRAGNGWSDQSPLPRTSQNIVDELHTLLHNANIPGPYILVGHSFGGGNVRLFASTYPNEVAGVVLVDAAHEDQIEKSPPLPKRNLSMTVFLTYIGGFRLVHHYIEAQKIFDAFPEHIKSMYFSQILTTKYINAFVDEWSRLEESMNQLKKGRGFLYHKPLIVITAGKFPTSIEVGGYPQEWIDKAALVHMSLQKDLVTKSTKGKQIIAENSGHMIPRDQPQIIVDAVHEIVNDLRTK